MLGESLGESDGLSDGKVLGESLGLFDDKASVSLAMFTSTTIVKAHFRTFIILRCL